MNALPWGAAMLSDQELLRYSRQVLLAQIDIDGQLRLKQSKALIVGLGGLGSPVALYLLPPGWVSCTWPTSTPST